MNPTLGEQQSLLISSCSCESDLDILLDASEEYMLDRSTALLIIENVVGVIKDWRQVAIRLQIPKSEIELFSYRLDKWGMWTLK